MATRIQLLYSTSSEYPGTRYTLGIVRVRKPILVHGVGFFRSGIFLSFSKLSNNWLPIEYRVHIWHVSPQLSCASVCFCKMINISHGKFPPMVWWRHQMETIVALLALCEGSHRSPMDSPHKSQWRGAFMFFYLRPNKRLSKQSRRPWFETPWCSLWRHCNGFAVVQQVSS